jgi:hypothetical protein
MVWRKNVLTNQIIVAKNPKFTKNETALQGSVATA